MTLADGTAGRERQTIVLVDDDAMIIAAMTEVLSGAGYEVHTARDGLEGLALIRAVKPDYIILDVVLPKLDGGRLCAALRQDLRFQRTPIISFSGLNPQDQSFFDGVKVDAYVAKGRLPVTAQNLLTALKGLAASAWATRPSAWPSAAQWCAPSHRCMERPQPSLTMDGVYLPASPAPSRWRAITRWWSSVRGCRPNSKYPHRPRMTAR